MERRVSRRGRTARLTPISVALRSSAAENTTASKVSPTSAKAACAASHRVGRDAPRVDGAMRTTRKARTSRRTSASSKARCSAPAPSATRVTDEDQQRTGAGLDAGDRLPTDRSDRNGGAGRHRDRARGRDRGRGRSRRTDDDRASGLAEDDRTGRRGAVGSTVHGDRRGEANLVAPGEGCGGSRAASVRPEEERGGSLDRRGGLRRRASHFGVEPSQGEPTAGRGPSGPGGQRPPPDRRIDGGRGWMPFPPPGRGPPSGRRTHTGGRRPPLGVDPTLPERRFRRSRCQTASGCRKGRPTRRAAVGPGGGAC